VLSIQARPTTVVIYLGSGFIRPSWEQVVTVGALSNALYTLLTRLRAQSTDLTGGLDD